MSNPQFFPGSRTPLTGVPGVPDEYTIPEEMGKDFQIQGRTIRLYGIGEVAEILKRKPVTIRKWETKGIIPKAVFVKNGVDPRGRRRQYSRAQVEILFRVAMEEKILHNPNLQISKTQFSKKVHQAFRELGAK